MQKLECGRARAGFSGALFGLLVVLAGTLLLLDNLDIVNTGRWWRYWPAALIALGISNLLSGRGRLWGMVLTIGGSLLLADQLGFGNMEGLIIPVLLIGFGAHLLFRAIARRKPPEISNDVRRVLNEWALFGGTKRQITAPDFEGGECLAIFGGVEVDLTKAAMQRPETVIDANAMFGGVELKVPQTWMVTVKGSGIFGGYEDKTVPPADGNSKAHLIVTGYAVFGGVTVQNGSN